MPCPYKHGFTRLPGQSFDDSARALRRSLEQGTMTPQDLLERCRSETVSSGFLKSATYALASFVIEAFWKFIKGDISHSAVLSLRSKCASMSYDVRVRRFIGCHLAYLRMMQKRFMDAFLDRVSKKDSFSTEDLLVVAFFEAWKRREPAGQGLPFPSMADLITSMGRLASAAPIVFARDIGRTPSHAEITALLEHPACYQLLVEMMSNSKESIGPLVGVLEGTSSPDLNDIGRTFTPDAFMVTSREGKFALIVRPEIAAAFIASSGSATCRPHALGCPALYTGKFREMYEWTCASLAIWLA